MQNDPYQEADHGKWLRDYAQQRAAFLSTLRLDAHLSKEPPSVEDLTLGLLNLASAFGSGTLAQIRLAPSACIYLRECIKYHAWHMAQDAMDSFCMTDIRAAEKASGLTLEGLV